MSLALFLIVLVAATGCGLSIARQLPWTDEARSDGVPLAVAVGLAPLLTGIATAIALWVLPTHRTSLHVALIIAALAAGAVPSARALAHKGWNLPTQLRSRLSLAEYAVCLLLAGFAVTAVADAVTTPLVQNDALEYATVGRILFEKGDLRVYPVLDSESTSSGFYAPWTHPPLYVALAYLSYALQGDAESTTLFRLIAPWCLIAAVLCVATVGRRVSRETGLLAALICISTPMLYLGAASAQIDPLPVLGFVLAFATFTSLAGSPVRQGVGCGLPLGLSLWTHSQAILFPVLLLPILFLKHSVAARLGDRIGFVCKAGVPLVAVAALVGGAPYIRNYLLFGVPISDNPPVFAYAPLGWDDFFKWQRGLAHPQEIVQYGVLKGLFAVEMYSFGFWLALLGIPMAARSLWARLKTSGSDTAAAVTALCLPASLLVVLVYFGGTVLSTLMGIDVMIRNERYLLVLMPCVAIMAAAGMARSTFVPAPFGHRIRTWLLVAVISMLSAQLVALELYRQKTSRLPATASTTAEAKDAAEYLRRFTPEDAKVLALKPADMFFSSRRMVSYLDPQLLPFYREQQAGPAFQALRRTGVSYIQVPDYALPAIYNSQLMNIVADPVYTELLYDRSGYQIYRLRDEVGQKAIESARAQQLQWRGEYRLTLGSSGGQVAVQKFAYEPGTPIDAWNQSLLLRRMTATDFISHDVRAETLVCSSGLRSDEYMINLQGSGNGFIKVMVNVAFADGTVERKVIGGITMADEGRKTTFVHRILVLPQARSMTVEVEFKPIATVTLWYAELHPVCS